MAVGGGVTEGVCVSGTIATLSVGDDTTKIYSMAGAEEQHPTLSTRELVDTIRRVGRQPIERDTLYNIVNDFTDTIFEEDKQWRGYIDLPVLQN